MKKVQEANPNLEVNNSLEASAEEKKFYNQGARPKVKNHVCHKGSKSSETLQNGSASQNERVHNFQNGASTSSISKSPSSSSSSSSSLSLSPPVNKASDFCENGKGDFLGEKCSAKGRTLSAEDNDLRCHDKKRKTGCFVDNESSSGNEGDDGLSGDDCCIYTYKGDQFADLPNSFFNVNMGMNEGHQSHRDNHRKANRGEPEADNERSNPGSSPEMDYLEMDFDPGPSLEQDSEEEIDGFDRKLNNVDSPVPELPNEQMFIDCGTDKKSSKGGVEDLSQEPQPGPSFCQWTPKKQSKVSDCNSNNNSRTKDYLENCAGCCCVDGVIENSNNSNQEVLHERIENGANDVNTLTCQILPGERLEKSKLTDKTDFCASREKENEIDLKTPFDGIMLWSEQEAISNQVTLVSPGVSCGATAVINAMLVLKMRFSIEKVKEGISTRLKSESGSIPQYLVSRSFAGVAHENLIRGIHHASQGALYARFFQMYPRRDIVLSRWLSHWMKKGAVPIATMNVQRDASADDPTLDTRHHQMIFGVNSKGIYLTDPLECLQDEEFWCRLISPSVLKIKRSEIVSRWSPGTNLKPLMFQSDDRWKKMNVLGQVVNIIRESPDPTAQGKFLTQHISIPGSSGITLVIPRDSSGYEELVSAADLPLLPSSKSE